MAATFFIKSAKGFLSTTAMALQYKSKNKGVMGSKKGGSTIQRNASAGTDNAMAFVNYMSKWMMLSGCFMAMYARE